MKIEKRSPELSMPFKEIPPGIVFKDEDNAICIKIEKKQNNFFYNAVNLETGNLYTYDDNYPIEILEDAILTY